MTVSFLHRRCEGPALRFSGPSRRPCFPQRFFLWFPFNLEYPSRAVNFQGWLVPYILAPYFRHFLDKEKTFQTAVADLWSGSNVLRSGRNVLWVRPQRYLGLDALCVGPAATYLGPAATYLDPAATVFSPQRISNRSQRTEARPQTHLDPALAY